MSEPETTDPADAALVWEALPAEAVPAEPVVPVEGVLVYPAASTANTTLSTIRILTYGIFIITPQERSGLDPGNPCVL
jgi:hypothetical protein